MRSDGTVACWGDNRSGQAGAPAGVFKAVSAGDGHSCAVSTEDTIECWGSDFYGEATIPSLLEIDRNRLDDTIPAETQSRWQFIGHSRGLLRVKLHICAERGFEHLFTRDDIAAYADAANRQVAPFYAWQSSGLLTVQFETGEIVASAVLTSVKDYDDWGELVPRDCLAAESNSPASGVVHYYVLYGEKYFARAGGRAKLGGSRSAIYLGPGYGRPFTPSNPDPGHLRTIAHELDHNLGLPHLTESRLGQTRVNLDKFPLKTGTIAGHPGSPNDPGTSVFPCYIMVEFGWPTGDGHPACGRPPPAEPSDVFWQAAPDGTIRAYWSPPRATFNPEQITGYEITVGECETAIGNECYWPKEVLGNPRTFLVSPDTRSLALPFLRFNVEYSVHISVVSEAGESTSLYEKYLHRVRHYGPSAQIRVMDRSNAEEIEYELSWDAVAGASHYLINGHENCGSWTRSTSENSPCPIKSETPAITLRGDNLVGDQSYEIVVHACGQGFKETRPLHSIRDCFEYGTTTITTPTVPSSAATPPSTTTPFSTAYTSVSAGSFHSCAVTINDTIVCWGSNRRGQAVEPAGTYRAVSAGGGHSCAVAADDTIDCWGNNDSGQADAPAGTFNAVSAGWAHSCAIGINATAACWGLNRHGQADAPAGAFKAVSAGTRHSCGLRADGTITCWGDNRRGQTDAPAGTYHAVSTVSRHSCGLKTDDTIACWGDNRNGQADPPAGSYRAISTGSRHSCGLKTDGTITCWGDNDFGQADPPAGTFKSLSGAYFHSCAINTDNSVTCWGNYVDERLDAPTTSSDTAGASPYRAVSAGGGHSCAIKSDDTVACWGDNHWRQAEAPAGTFKSVSAGGEHSCAIKSDDTIACWGDKRSGQADPPAGTFKSVSASPRRAVTSAGDHGHTCAIKTDDSITCWGSNDSGQADAPAGTFKAVSAGGYHSCAIKSDDTVTCWGNSNTWHKNHAPAGTFRSVSAGTWHSCGLKTDGTVVCWGSNSVGQVGMPADPHQVNSYRQHGTPTDAFKSVSAGANHTCATKTDGSIACWGANHTANRLDESGQTDAPAGTFKSVSAGSYYTCALKTDGTTVCWGNGKEFRSG